MFFVLYRMVLIMSKLLFTVFTSLSLISASTSTFAMDDPEETRPAVMSLTRDLWGYAKEFLAPNDVKLVIRSKKEWGTECGLAHISKISFTPKTTPDFISAYSPQLRNMRSLIIGPE